MDGVNILYTWEVGCKTSTAILGIFIAVLSLIVIGAVIYMCIKDKEAPSGTPLILFFGALGLVAGILISVNEFNAPIVTHYKVEVEDSVPFNEFSNKYEIISREGSIWEVVEKEAGDH